MRKFVLCTIVASCFQMVTLAQAQQIDLMFGESTLFSSTSNSASLTTVGAEKGGGYLAAGANVMFKHRFGLNVEGAWRAKQGLNAFGQPYRPILVDGNGLFQPRISEKIGVDLMGGVGFQLTRFYGLLQNSACVNYTVCYVSDTHFLVHMGGGLRYYVFGRFFLRPEAHYYYVNNNFQFHSGNIVRLGASLGYTFGSK